MKNKLLKYIIMNYKKQSSIVLIAVLLTSCKIHKGYLKFEKKADEIIALDKVKKIINENKSPTIVLRVPEMSESATQSDQNNYIYNAIEKELVINGFNVKDRGLFNQVIKSQKDLDYTKINELAGAELILELIKVETKIPYKTNRAFTENNKEIILENLEYQRVGASIEFKLIIVNNNEYGGSYKFNYSPCIELNEDCLCKVPYKGKKKFLPNFYASFCNKDEKVKVSAYEKIPKDELEIFIRGAVSQLIKTIK